MKKTKTATMRELSDRLTGTASALDACKEYLERIGKGSPTLAEQLLHEKAMNALLVGIATLGKARETHDRLAAEVE